MLAQQSGITNPILDSLSGLVGGDYFGALIRSLLGLSFVIAAIVFIFIIVIGAIQWISSGGDKQGIQAAQSKVTNAIIGLVILLSLFAILKVIGTFFGLEIFQNFTIDFDKLIIQ